MYIKRALAVLTITVASFSAQAASQYAVNGHYYELFTFTDVWRLNWDEAKAYAENSLFNGSQGHLATITSQGEDEFVWGLGAQSFYLGASDNSILTLDQETNTWKWTHQNWQWVTGEDFSQYSNWFDREPNHWNDNYTGYDLAKTTSDIEDYLMYWSYQDGSNHRWNDTSFDSAYVNEGGILKYTTRGFVVEYEPITADLVSAAVPSPSTLMLFVAGLGALIRSKKTNRLSF